MFSRLKRHDNPSCSVHQTSSYIQVLRQHNLQIKNKISQCFFYTETERSVHMLNCSGYGWDDPREKQTYLSSHFELQQSADGAVSIYSLLQDRVTIKSLKFTDRPWGAQRPYMTRAEDAVMKIVFIPEYNYN